MKLPIKCLKGNDLSVDFLCECNNPKYNGTPLEGLLQTRIYLSGYSDSNFFDNVNKNKRPFKCNVCKKEYTQQWFREGYVEVENA